MPVHVVAAMHRFEEHHRPAARAAPAVTKVRPGIAPKDVAAQARMMKWMMPLMTSWLVQRLASWASVVPQLRRAAYEIAGMAFARRYVFRMADVPLTLCQDFLARNQQVYETMWGPSEFFATGVLKDWNVESRLGEIDVPTLILSGRHDEATPAQQERLRAGIPGSQWTILNTVPTSPSSKSPSATGRFSASFLDGVESGARRAAWVNSRPQPVNSGTRRSVTGSDRRSEALRRK